MSLQEFFAAIVGIYLVLFECVFYSSLGIQSPCQRMIGMYKQLRNAMYLGSITILRRWLDP